ncbi:hypothetical protein AEAC466_13645 [Asticcacaulis sp. AC466]|uniref:alpha/beta hydrolase family protein n=1 Tax=Asticcacaulis sp. AC466 TaxID=1282362 RepID=UPI0003C3D1F2|nr:alpha/beta hydrolase [Asticcacaulis sp. AC466]ESQ83290.1 hypothetical protein AEAC466_13645 [Asticcacaulis sp. AC466]
MAIRWHGALALYVLIACAGAAAARTVPPKGLDGNFDEALAGGHVLPDPLVMRDGRPVTSARMWRVERRPELVALFEDTIFGVAPPPPKQMRSVVTDTDTKALGGTATRKQVTLYLNGDTQGPQMHVLIYLPNGVKAAPVFVGLNFHGNQAINDDPAIDITTTWLTDYQSPGIVKHHATAASRGQDAAEWPLAKILAAGYGVATFAPGDLYPDSDNMIAESVHPFYGTQSSAPNHWGAIATWAWGMSRVYDYLATDHQVDAHRIIAIGHSRYGKAALWAGARDTRFAMVVANDSGAGGAKLYRRNFGESIRVMNTYWFAPRFKTFASRENDLPVDAHELIALVAPRPVYIATASEDLWGDTTGQFLAAQAADPVYRLLGTQGLGVSTLPPPDTPVHSIIGFHIRTGPHAITDYDWSQYLRFADTYLHAKIVTRIVK